MQAVEWLQILINKEDLIINTFISALRQAGEAYDKPGMIGYVYVVSLDSEEKLHTRQELTNNSFTTALGNFEEDECYLASFNIPDLSVCENSERLITRYYRNSRELKREARRIFISLRWKIFLKAIKEEEQEDPSLSQVRGCLVNCCMYPYTFNI